MKNSKNKIQNAKGAILIFEVLIHLETEEITYRGKDYFLNNKTIDLLNVVVDDRLRELAKNQEEKLLN